MKPLDAIRQAMMSVGYESRDLRGPGKVIGLLSKETREALSRLTADELNKLRIDPWELMSPYGSLENAVRYYVGERGVATLQQIREQEGRTRYLDRENERTE